MVDIRRLRSYEFTRQELEVDNGFSSSFSEDYLGLKDFVRQMNDELNSVGSPAPILGSGSPEGQVAARPGRFYVNTDTTTEIVENGDFTDGINGWTAFNAVISEVNQRMRVDDSLGAGSWSSGWQEIDVTPNTEYVLEWSQTFVSASAATVAVSTVAPNTGGTGRIATLQNHPDEGSSTLTFIPTTATVYLWFVVGGNDIVDFGNIRVRIAGAQSVYIKATGTGNTGWVAT